MAYVTARLSPLLIFISISSQFIRVPLWPCAPVSVNADSNMHLCARFCRERSIAAATAAVYYFDAATRNWKNVDGGLSSVNIYENTANGSFRVVAMSVKQQGTVRFFFFFFPKDRLVQHRPFWPSLRICPPSLSY